MHRTRLSDLLFDSSHELSRPPVSGSSQFHHSRPGAHLKVRLTEVITQCVNDNEIDLRVSWTDKVHVVPSSPSDALAASHLER